MLLILSLMVMVLLILALPGVTSAKTNPSVDSAKGQGVEGSGVTFKFSAKNQSVDPTTNDAAKGKFYLKGTHGDHSKGKVVCLEASSDGAADFQGKVTRSNATPKGHFIPFDMLDSGQPNGEGDLFAVGGSSPGRQSCHPPTGEGLPISSGNIVVHGSLPPAP